MPLRSIMLGVLLMTLSLSLSGVAAEKPIEYTDYKFSGSTIPEARGDISKIKDLPESVREWKEPAQLLFEQGMAMPQGEYRQIKIGIGGLWSNKTQIIQVHGWVLPARKNADGNFAVCWNGLVYPVIEVGEPCDLREDVRQLIAKSTTKNKEWRGDVVNESDAVACDTLLPLKIPLILAGGDGKLAKEIFAAWREKEYNNHFHPYSQKPGESYLAWAKEWTFQIFNRGICAILRKDLTMAILSFQKLEVVLPAVQKESDKWPDEDTKEMKWRYSFAREVPRILADLERKKAEPPFDEALLKSPDQKVRIEAFIHCLESLNDMQGGQPGGVEFGRDPIVIALIKEGKPAVEPLLECLEKDTRLTNSIHFWRDFVASRTVLGVQEPAYAALAGIMEMPFVHVRSTGEDLTSKGPEERVKLAQTIRDYWNKTKDLPREQVWFNILADDNAAPDDWGQAAWNIVRPVSQQVIPSTMAMAATVTNNPAAGNALAGEPLRSKQNPSLTDLLIRRMEQLNAPPQDASFKRPKQALSLAEALMKWDGVGGAKAVQTQCNAIVSNYGKNPKFGELGESLINVVLRLIEAGHTEIFEDYAGWLESVPPNCIASPNARAAGVLWFQPMWRNSSVPCLQKAATHLFSKNESAWRSYLNSGSGWNTNQNLLISPMLGVEPCREMILAALNDKTRAGECGYLTGTLWMVRLDGDNLQLASYANASALPNYGIFRVCDLWAWELSKITTFPHIELYDAEADRDKAVTQCAEILKRKGNKYKELEAKTPIRFLIFAGKPTVEIQTASEASEVKKP
ncbi:MAG: hypothetical protein ABI443_02335 [Chthoniobacterales bacterium]